MDRVINRFIKRPDAAVRLVCFPWAGGGSTHYARWGQILNCSVEDILKSQIQLAAVRMGDPYATARVLHVLTLVYAVRLRGREARAKEAFFQHMQEILNEVIDVLLPELKEKPFALFGHSFGAMTAYAFAEYVKKVHSLEPVHVFLSGASAPFSEMRLQAPRRSQLSDEEFLQWMTTIGGTPPEILANSEVLKLFLPALKADLSVVENYRCSRPQNPFLSCPVSCFDGKEDMPHDLQAWKIITTGDFNVHMLSGSHFYLKDAENEKVILDYITKHLETAEMNYL